MELYVGDFLPKHVIFDHKRCRSSEVEQGNQTTGCPHSAPKPAFVKPQRCESLPSLLIKPQDTLTGDKPTALPLI